MCGQECFRERKTEVEAMEEMGRALHSLCQPLTTLQCRLEMAELVGSIEAYREAIALGLVECGRLVDGVGLMREILRSAESSSDGRRERTSRRI